MAKHINFAGYKVRVDMDELLPGDEVGIVEFEVKEVEFPEGEDWGCDFCSGPSVAVYELDAESVLGDAGYNTMYCQAHAALAAAEDPNEWVAPHSQ